MRIEGDDESVRALEGRGYEAVRWDAQMLRPDLADLPDRRGPGRLRDPGAGGGRAARRLRGDGRRRSASTGGSTTPATQRFDEWVEDPRFRRDLVVVAWQGDAPVACLSDFLEPAPDGTIRGYLDPSRTHPDHRRRGLGRAAMAESLRRLRAAGAAERLARRRHGEPQPGARPVRGLRLRRGHAQRQLPQAVRDPEEDPR